MTIGKQVPTPPKITKTQEDVKVGDAVFVMIKIDKKEVKREYAVKQRIGTRLKLIEDDNFTTCWVDATQIIGITVDGAEEFLKRAEVAAAKAEEERLKKEALKKAADEAKRIEDAKAAAKAAEVKRIYTAYMERAGKTIDWMPTGSYFNLDHLPIPDHQKDIYRIVHWEIDVDKNFKLKESGGVPKYGPDNVHTGDTVFFTDGSVTHIPYVVGSVDGVCKGDGGAIELVKEFGFKTATIELKEAFDGGRTLKKHDSYPPEDPGEFKHNDTELYGGMVRVDELANGTEIW